MKKKTALPLLGFLVALALHVGLWAHNRTTKPDFIVVPEPPSVQSAKAYGLGDDQLYFRRLAFTLQNAGDTFGRFTALKDYDYAKLEQWFHLMDALDKRSDMVPTMAGYYYSQSQNVSDVQYIINYLVAHVERNLDIPEKQWWWLVQAVYLANHRLKDRQQALDISYKILDFPADAVPIWAKQMPAFLHEDMGESEAAFRIMQSAYQEYSEKDNISAGELNFIQHFLRNRIAPVSETPDLERDIERYREKRGLGVYPEMP